MEVTPLYNAYLSMAPESTTRKKSLRVCGRSEVDVVVSNCGVTVAPVEVVCVKPGTPAWIPFLIDAPWFRGVGGGEAEVDEPFTPPHPTVRARSRGLKKNKNALLKGTRTSP